MKQWLEAVMTTISSWSGNATGLVLGGLHRASPMNYREDKTSWWCTPVTLARRREAQGPLQVWASQGFTARHYLQKEKRWGSGCRRDGWKVESPTVCAENSSSVSSTYLGGSQPPLTLGDPTHSIGCCAHRNTCGKHTHMHAHIKIKTKLKKVREEAEIIDLSGLSRHRAHFLLF